jgi:hypothetical protein
LLIRIRKTQCFHYCDDDVGVNDCLTHCPIQDAIERVVMRFLKAGRIQEEKLRGRIGQNAGYAMARRLRFVGRDTDFLTYQMI